MVDNADPPTEKQDGFARLARALSPNRRFEPTWYMVFMTVYIFGTAYFVRWDGPVWLVISMLLALFVYICCGIIASIVAPASLIVNLLRIAIGLLSFKMIQIIPEVDSQAYRICTNLVFVYGGAVFYSIIASYPQNFYIDRIEARNEAIHNRRYTCPKCSFISSEGSQHCGSCGAELLGSGPLPGSQEEMEAAKTKSLTCLKCDEVSGEGAKFCNSCGEPLPAFIAPSSEEADKKFANARWITCNECGATMPKTARFCNSCNVSLLEFGTPYPAPE